VHLKNFKVQEVLQKEKFSYPKSNQSMVYFYQLSQQELMTFAEYETNRVHQFYSNLSILDNYGNEVAQQTISVNNPLRYKNVDFIKVIGILEFR
jgi:cytochrome c biogenesis protein ResB